MNHLHAIDYLIILVVLGITLYLGFRFSKKQNTTENYFLSKGNFPSWALGLSLLSTLISSVTFLGYPAQGFSSNWILLVQGLMVPIVLAGTIWFIVPLYRKVIGLGTYDLKLTQLTLIVMVINGAFYAIQKYGTDQTVVQRYLTAKTDKSAIRASMLGISLTIPIWTMFMFIGTALFVFYKQQGLPAGTKAESVFPYFMTTQLPTGILGFIVAALISAAIC